MAWAWKKPTTPRPCPSDGLGPGPSQIPDSPALPWAHRVPCPPPPSYPHPSPFTARIRLPRPRPFLNQLSLPLLTPSTDKLRQTLSFSPKLWSHTPPSFFNHLDLLQSTCSLSSPLSPSPLPPPSPLRSSPSPRLVVSPGASRLPSRHSFANSAGGYLQHLPRQGRGPLSLRHGRQERCRPQARQVH